MEDRSTFDKVACAVVGVVMGAMVCVSMCKAGMIEAGVIVGIMVACFIYTKGE